MKAFMLILPLAACGALQAAGPTVAPTVQTLIAAYTGAPPAVQCQILNTVRTYYPAKVSDFVDRVGTKTFICVDPQTAETF